MQLLIPQSGGSAQAAHRHYTRPFPSERKRCGYARLPLAEVACMGQEWGHGVREDDAATECLVCYGGMDTPTR